MKKQTVKNSNVMKIIFEVFIVLEKKYCITSKYNCNISSLKILEY